jgi:monofunctional biosynthetic peptidoglycan transglycosylase
MKRRSLPARIARAAALALALAVGLFRVVPVPLTAFMLQDGERPRRHDWVPWEQISRHAAVAVIASEDQRFLEHGGFDFEAIDKALTDARRGRRLRGASTISQQVAKNLFLWPGQSWPRKGLEAWFTLWIELLWPKQRILEVYLNSVEFGRGVWGVEAASRLYFGKPAARLNRPQAALLAAVLPNPKRFRVASPSAYVRQRQDWILWQMGMLERAGSFRTLEPAPH